MTARLDDAREFFQQRRVPGGKAIRLGTVNVHHAEGRAVHAAQRDNDFRARSAVAGDMAGKRMYVGHDERFVFFKRRAAYAAAGRDAYARGLALKGTEPERAVFFKQVKAGPVDVFKRAGQKRRRV